MWCTWNTQEVKDKVGDERVSYTLIGRGKRSGYGETQSYIHLETNTPEILFVRDVRKGVNDKREVYIVIECSGNKKLMLEGISAKSFEEQVGDIHSVRSSRIKITRRVHMSANRWRYYTVDVERL
jgi:hypothetical protein